jgi:hypothetical protein
MTMQDPFAVKEQYNDSIFDQFMVNYFAQKMSEQLGGGSVHAVDL